VQGFIPGTFEFPSDDPGAQAKQVLKNLSTILESAGSDLKHVLKITMFMVNTEDFPKINEAINEAFPDNSPARNSIAVAELPRHAKCVIEAIAAIP
jgi:2-iminobutanoate/2-iminopropanoate deaminase